jgi:hypothetical protein
MADDGEYGDDDDDPLGSRRPKLGYKSARGRDDDDARRAARRALSHVWSKTERMNCERALLSFGYGRWARIKETAQGGTRLRTEAELAAFGLAFLCLCVGVPIGGVGGVSEGGSSIPVGGAPSAAEREGVAASREVLREMGCGLPVLSASDEDALEPLISAGGSEYAERLHKVGASLLQRLVVLKRLSDAIERWGGGVLRGRYLWVGWREVGWGSVGVYLSGEGDGQAQGAEGKGESASPLLLHPCCHLHLSHSSLNPEPF